MEASWTRRLANQQQVQVPMQVSFSLPFLFLISSSQFDGPSMQCRGLTSSSSSQFGGLAIAMQCLTRSSSRQVNDLRSSALQ